MKKFVLMLPLASLVLAGCEYTRKTPAAPTPVQQVVEQPAPAPTVHTAYPSNGEELIAFVAQRYPDKLTGGVSHGERVANMEFIRDRIIEAGICGGMRLSWNLKRGVGPRSIDAIAWRPGDGDATEVVDLALDYDNGGPPLRLHWIVVSGPPGWDTPPAPDCQ